MNNNKKTFYIVLLSQIGAYLFAQAPDTLWTRTFGSSQYDEGYSVHQTNDKGCIVTGYSDSISTLGYIYLVKTDSLGNTVWSKLFAPGQPSHGFSVQQTADGGYVICGNKREPMYNSYDLYILKTNANGDSVWAKRYGYQYADWGRSIQQTTDGGYVCTGFVTDDFTGDQNVWLLRTDAFGDTLWTKFFGGYYGDAGSSVQQTIDGGFIVAGTYGYSGNTSDIYLVKSDSLGNMLWSRTYGGDSVDNGNSVQQTFDGGYIITGTTYGAGSSDIYLIKTNINGDTSWTQNFGGSSYDYGSSVQQTTDSGYVLAGQTSSFGAGESDVWIIKTNSLGDTMWTKTVGGIDADNGHCVKQTTDGGYIIAGSTMSHGAGYHDVYLIKLGGAIDIGIEQILLPDSADSGSIVIPQIILRNYGAINQTPWIYCKIGSFYADSLSQIVPPGYDTVAFQPCTLIQIGSHYVIAYSVLPSDINPNNDTLIDTIIVFATGVCENKAETEEIFRVWPTITRKTLTVSVTNGFCIYDVCGKLVDRFRAQKIKTYDLRKLPPGIYFIKSTNRSTNEIRKVIMLQ